MNGNLVPEEYAQFFLHPIFGETYPCKISASFFGSLLVHLLFTHAPSLFRITKNIFERLRGLDLFDILTNF